MFLDRKETGKKKNSDLAVIGYDLGKKEAQISYYLPGRDKPETISVMTGEEQFSIPAALCRRKDKDTWAYGKEAVECSRKGNGILLDHLLENALEAKSVKIDGMEYDSVTLLSIFIKRSLSLLSMMVTPDRIGAYMFSLDTTDKRSIEVLSRAAALLDFKDVPVWFQNRAESFYYYNMNQPQELMEHEVLVFDFTGENLKSLRFSTNRRTTPVAAFVEEESHPQVNKEGLLYPKEADRAFAKTVSELCGKRVVDTVYLIGDGFAEEWYQDALKVLCRNRRVFLGNNLYSKGACYAAKERLTPGKISKEYVFLGNDMIKANVGMYTLNQGTEGYFPLLDAGGKWYEAGKSCDFLLEESNSFTLRLMPLNSREAKEVIVTLDGLPARPSRASRIHMEISMADAQTVRLTMEDMGFGEFFPATHKVWEETFPV